MSIDAVYRERDELVSFLSKIFSSYLAPSETFEEGWSYIVYVETPKGQLSWHVPDHEILPLFSHLRIETRRNWDGHSTEEKYRRLQSLDITDIDGVI